MLKFKNKLYVKGKVARNVDGIVEKLYWNCSSRGCKGAIRYMIDILQVGADHLGHGPGIINVVVTEHTPEVCKVSNVAIVQRVARSDIISRASAGGKRLPQPVFYSLKSLTLLGYFLQGVDLNVAYAAVVNTLQIHRPDVVSTMPAANRLKSAYGRAKLAKYPEIPHDLNNLVIPAEFAETTAGEPFLMFNDSFASVPDGPIDSKMLVFCSTSFFKDLCEAEDVYMDGTFAITPPGFHQYFTIHTFIGGNRRLIPRMHCLLTGKSRFMYERLFTAIKNEAILLNLILKWKRSMQDYESGLWPALANSFPPPFTRRGCFFHFCNAVYRWFQEHLKVHSLSSNTLNEVIRSNNQSQFLFLF